MASRRTEVTTQTEALFLADELEAPLGTVISGEVDRRAAIELRRQHALNGELLEALKAMLAVWEEDPAYGATHADKARAAIARAEGKV
jgi:hypothetical protein